ncbi:hypothetical protein GCM10022261_15620 [Brevibacterium daeguense]|uniref:ATP synthase protein I n=1 Tax=Brevibacterium daeguense TaxID=909936 RepID=A0ABP8EJ94_9MICO
MTANDSVRSIMRGIVLRGLLITAAIAVVASIIGVFAAGMAGVWGALIGAATAFVFFAITAVLMYFTADSSPTVMAGAVLGGFLVKVAGLIALTAGLRNLDFYNPWVLFVTLAVAAFASLIVDVFTVQRARLPIIDEK